MPAALRSTTHDPPPRKGTTPAGTVPLTVRLPNDVYRAVNEAARRDDRTINNWIVRACRNQADIELSS